MSIQMNFNIFVIWNGGLQCSLAKHKYRNMRRPRKCLGNRNHPSPTQQDPPEKTPRNHSRQRRRLQRGFSSWVRAGHSPTRRRRHCASILCFRGSLIGSRSLQCSLAKFGSRERVPLPRLSTRGTVRPSVLHSVSRFSVEKARCVRPCAEFILCPYCRNWGPTVPGLLFVSSSLVVSIIWSSEL